MTMLAANFDTGYFLHFVFHPTHALIVGLQITVIAAVLSEFFGTCIGTLSALAGLAKSRTLRAVSKFYVWFFRGVPTLVQIFLVYFGVPAFLGTDPFPTDTHIGPFTVNGAIVAGVLALSINEGAYMSEIVRAGILSVDRGQEEAALAVGMTHRTAMRRIILPQAARVIIPPLGNNFNNMLKITSLLSIIGVEELFRVTQDTQSASFKTFETYLGAALYYLALVTIWALIQRLIERHFDVVAAHERRSREAGAGFGTISLVPARWRRQRGDADGSAYAASSDARTAGGEHR